MSSKREKLYLVDGSSYIFRAFYAIQPLSTSKGLPTNALYGFVRMLLKLVKDEKPDKLAIVFDTEEETFRDELYEDYKANRKEPPDDLIPQFPYFEPIVDALGINKLSKPGFEADDVIGTVARHAAENGYDVTIVTGDKDFMQLVDDHIKLYDTMKDRRIGRDEVKEKFGVEPHQVIDVMTLMGDSTDNIPGVSGIGEKGAKSLIQQFGDLENLFANVDKVSNLRSKNAIKEGRKDAELSKKLVTIKLDVPLEYKWSDFNIKDPDSGKIGKLFTELEFFKLMREMMPAEEGDKRDFKITSDEDGLNNLAKEVNASDKTAVYFLEAGKSGANPYIGFGVACDGKDAVYIPMVHETLEDVANVNKGALRSFFEKIKEQKLIVYDIKSLWKLGIIKNRDILDVRLMSYVLNPSYPADITTFSQQLLGVDMSRILGPGSLAAGNKSRGKSFTIKEAAHRVCVVAETLLKLEEKLSEDLSKNKDLRSLFYDIELPLTEILYKMEKKGIKVDIDQLEKLSKEYAKKILDLEGEIHKEAGEQFVINSPKQLSNILFEKLSLPVIKKTKTGFSTDAGVLEELAQKYELPKMILEYRSLTKLKSTYIDALPLLAGDKNHRVHTTFNQAVTATGRLSSSDPNLQNVPARTDEGMRIRKAFITDKGYKLISADYSQIELRVLAHISGEKVLLDAFENGIDVHAATAARIFGISEPDIDSKMRGAAKTVNFGVLYGQSAFGLSKQLGIEVYEADEYIKNYYKSYPFVKKLKEKILEDALSNGYVETIFGRRRYVPDINSHNPQMRAFAERTAFNAVFQGTAADIIKKAMIELDQALEKDFPDTSMLLQVHDELVFEAPASRVDELSKVVKEKMCGVVTLRVPLTVDIGVGNNWAECKS